MFVRESGYSGFGTPKQKTARTGWWKQGFPQRELLLDQQRLRMVRTEGQYPPQEASLADVSIVEAGIAEAVRALESGPQV